MRRHRNDHYPRCESNNFICCTKICFLNQSLVLSNCDLRPVMAHNIPWCITSAQQSSKSTRAVCWPQLVWLMVNVDYVRLCQEIKDDGLLPETCHDHNNHAAAAISLTRSEWGMAEVRLNKDVFRYQEAALNMSI